VKLRVKLLIPVLCSIYVGFSIFVLVQYAAQSAAGKKKLDREIADLTELVVTSNMSYIWNYDMLGLQASIETLKKDEMIAEIEIFDVAGKTIAKATEEAKPALIKREADILRDGAAIGRASIVFTDYPIKSEIVRFSVTIILLMVAIFVFIGIMMVFIARIVTRPVSRLASVVKEMAEGEADLTARIPVKGKDEVAELSTHFNAFLDKLKAIIASLKTVGAQSRSLGTDLSSNAQTVSASSSQISASMGSMSERTAHLRDEIARQRAAVERVDAFSVRVVEMIQDQAAAVNESSAAVEEMIANVSTIERSTESKLQIVKGLETLAKELDEGVSLNVKAMEEASQSTELIAEMITVINGVASQTNLLAMNAAIEAAHAGEYGRGFSVVADEIRKLAEQTGMNAKSIGDSIGKVVEGIERATSMARSASSSIERVLSGVAEVANGMNETMAGLKEIAIGNRQITESLGALNRMTEDVKSSGSEMREGTAGVESSMRVISEITEENSSGMEEMTAGVKEIADSIDKLTGLSAQNASNIGVLDGEIAKFKTE